MSRVFVDTWAWYALAEVCIDISGCRRIVDVMRMATAHAAALRPQVIVVKSTALRRLVRHCIVWPGS